jgi:multidrug transporter EmrE-like cation transporter
MLYYLFLFTLGMITDLAWVSTVRASAKGQATPAALWTTVLTLIGLVSSWVVIAQDSVPYAITYTLGCGIGAWLTVRYSHHRDAKHNLRDEEYKNVRK